MDVFVFALVVHTVIAPMIAPIRPNLVAAGWLGFTGIVLGAFGAHALKDQLATSGMTQAWQTAVLYHLLHAVAFVALPAWLWVRRLWLAGIFLFCGSLYWLALGGPKILGPITPLGGVTLLCGWALLVWQAHRLPKP
jgi:uncharacterized membrane protein YgdD (TMEM256/DUF423 family)